MIMNMDCEIKSIQTGRRFASGTTKIVNGYLTFYTQNGESQQYPFIRVEQEFGFVPSFIYATWKRDNLASYTVMYMKEGFTTDSHAVINMTGVFMVDNRGGSFEVNEHRFVLPLNLNALTEVEWFAYE